MSLSVVFSNVHYTTGLIFRIPLTYIDAQGVMLLECDCCLCVNNVTDFHCSASSMSVESYLENGRKLLAAGQLADALTQYHAAVGTLHTFVYNQN